MFLLFFPFCRHCANADLTLDALGCMRNGVCYRPLKTEILSKNKNGFLVICVSTNVSVILTFADVDFWVFWSGSPGFS